MCLLNDDAMHDVIMELYGVIFMVFFLNKNIYLDASLLYKTSIRHGFNIILVKIKMSLLRFWNTLYTTQRNKRPNFDRVD